MPGMMDTVLDVGLDDDLAVAEEPARHDADAELAAGPAEDAAA
jgi:hypothetical protein